MRQQNKTECPLCVLLDATRSENGSTGCMILPWPGLAGLRSAVATRHHRDCVDRLVFLFHRAGLRTSSASGLARRRLWRRMAGPWWWLLSYPEISGCPAEMPEHLTWFKWESYATWLSGFTLLCIVYYAGADLYLVDPNVLDVSAPTAIAISIASLAFGWIAYNTICKLMLGKSDTLLMVILYCILVVMAGAIRICLRVVQLSCIWELLPRQSCLPTCSWSSFRTRKSWWPI